MCVCVCMVVMGWDVCVDERGDVGVDGDVVWWCGVVGGVCVCVCVCEMLD